MALDLTKEFPRSPRERLGGIAILPRAIDKARAQLAGTLGSYIYFDCGINRVLFTMLHVSDQQFLDAVARAKNDDDVLRWIREELQPSEAAIARMNAFIEHLEPRPEQQAHFDAMLQAADPGNTAVTRWVDLLDLEEGRLPKGSGAAT
ncbi:DUF5069 domain-containing protein [Vulcanimicrobium alpinum]|nr:DUF5069 domain-containing protein [Vulcanimicrobium alpinum]